MTEGRALRWYVALAVVFCAGTVRAGPLEEAQQALATGSYARASMLAEPLVNSESLGKANRAEAYRVLGLARFFLGDRAGCKEAFYGYLTLDADAHLDPALVPPEAIVVLEEVRTERAAALAAARPRPKRKSALNLVPPFGQFQNRQPIKGGILGGLEVALLAGNITTYALLRKWCDEDDQTCGDRRGQARVARTLNIASFAGFIAVYAYGVIDGYVVMRRRDRAEEMQVGVIPTDGGASFVVGGRF